VEAAITKENNKRDMSTSIEGILATIIQPYLGLIKVTSIEQRVERTLCG
jgi:hypothetical protein